MCDTCTSCICMKCVKRNLGEAEFHRINNAKSWDCYGSATSVRVTLCAPPEKGQVARGGTRRAPGTAGRPPPPAEGAGPPGRHPAAVVLGAARGARRRGGMASSARSAALAQLRWVSRPAPPRPGGERPATSGRRGG